MYLEFDIVASQELMMKSLESDAKGIELIAVTTVHRSPEADIKRATVYVPHGQLQHFENKIRQYLERVTEKGRPRNEPLVASIEDIRLFATR